MWSCLSCAVVACSPSGHAESHHESTLHSVFLSLSNDDDIFVVHCFDCNRQLRDRELPPRVTDVIAAIRQQQINPPSFADDSSIGAEPPLDLPISFAALPTATAATTTAPRRRSRRNAIVRDKTLSAVESHRRQTISKFFERWRLAAEHVRAQRKAVAHGADAAASTAALTAAVASDESDSLEPASRSKLPKPGRGSLLLTRSSIKTVLFDDLANSTSALRTTRPTAASVRERPRSTLVPGETGIRNLGNTCYMNAVLQCLSNTPAFRQFFLAELDQSSFNVSKKTKLQRIDTATCLATMLNSDAVKAKSKREHTVAEQLYALLRVLWSGKWSVVTPHSLIEEVWRAMPKYRNHLQHDAQEFLGDMMELLERELSTAGTLCPDPAAHAAARLGAITTSTAARTAKSNNKKRGVVATTSSSSVARVSLPTHLSCLFRGKLRSDVVCQRCKRVSSTEEPFWQLTLDLPREAEAASSARRSARTVSPRRAPEQARSSVSCTLSDCFAAFCASESVPQYACEHCPSRQLATKSLHIVEMPQVLVVVLKRFRWDGNGSKIDTTVTFDLDDVDVNGTTYELTGVVVHHGRTLRSGHYTAYLRHDDRWLHANDNKINTVSEDVVLSQSSQVYLLFFQQVDNKPVARRGARMHNSSDDSDDD